MPIGILYLARYNNRACRLPGLKILLLIPYLSGLKLAGFDVKSMHRSFHSRENFRRDHMPRANPNRKTDFRLVLARQVSRQLVGSRRKHMRTLKALRSV